MATATVAGTMATMAAAAAAAAKTMAVTAQKSKKEDKLERWRQILAEGEEQPPAVRGWTDEDEQRLLALSASEIGLADTCIGRELKHQKREMEAAIEHFSLEDRNAMRRKLDEINAKEALTKALEEAPMEETSAGEWQGEASAD
jgi:hypothetical protein